MRRRSGVLGLAFLLQFSFVFALFAVADGFFAVFLLAGTGVVSECGDFFVSGFFFFELECRDVRKGRIEEAPPALPLAMDLAGASGLRFSLFAAVLPLLFSVGFREF